ncbi:MAG: hypothetical protein ACJ8FS_02065 [Sphingomicrobium sp.]
MSALVSITAALAQATTASPAPAPAPAPVAASTEGPKVGTTTYLDVEAGAGYSSNPLLSLTSNTGRAFGRIVLHAVHARVSARTTTVISAYASNDTYTGRYGSQQALSFDARHDASVNEHLRLFGDVEASYDEGGQLDTRIVSNPDVPPPPGNPATPPALLAPSSDFLSVTGHYYRLGAHAGGNIALSPQDSLTFSSGVDRSIFHSRQIGQNTSFWSIPASIAYERQLSPRATVGVRTVFQNTNYDGPASFRVITPQVTAQLQLSETTSFGGAVGASFASIDNGIRTRHTTGLSANASLCNKGERSQFCARAAVDQQTATTAGPAKSISAGIDYSRRLDVDSTIQFSLDGTRYSSPTSIVPGATFSSSNYYRAAASYTRSFGHRLFGGVDLSARKLTQKGPDPRADLSASLFVRYRFGDVR